MRHFLRTGNDTDLIQCPNVWTQSTMDAKHSAVNDGGKVEVVKDLAAALPDVGIAVFALALVVKAVYLGDLSTLVVAPEQSDAGRMSRLEGHE